MVRQKGRFESNGKMNKKGHTCYVKELPILLWTDKYIQHLNSLRSTVIEVKFPNKYFHIHNELLVSFSHLMIPRK